jgi:hypothetical protein
MAMRMPMKLKRFITPVSAGTLCIISPPLKDDTIRLGNRTAFARFYGGAIHIPNVLAITRIKFIL